MDESGSLAASGHWLHPFAGITRIRFPFRLPLQLLRLRKQGFGQIDHLSRYSGTPWSSFQIAVRYRFFQSSNAWVNTSSPESPFDSVTKARLPVE